MENTFRSCENLAAHHRETLRSCENLAAHHRETLRSCENLAACHLETFRSCENLAAHQQYLSAVAETLSLIIGKLFAVAETLPLISSAFSQLRKASRLPSGHLIINDLGQNQFKFIKKSLTNEVRGKKSGWWGHQPPGNRSRHCKGLPEAIQYGILFWIASLRSQ